MRNLAVPEEVLIQLSHVSYTKEHHADGFRVKIYSNQLKGYPVLAILICHNEKDVLNQVDRVNDNHRKEMIK